MSKEREQILERVSLFSAAAKKAANNATETPNSPSQNTTVLSPYDPPVHRDDTQSPTQVLGVLSQTFAPVSAEPATTKIAAATMPSDNTQARSIDGVSKGKADNKEKSSKSKKKVWIAAAAVIGLLAIGYFSGTYIYSHRFFPNTTFGSVDVSNKTFEEAQTTIEKSARDYSLTVTGQGLDFVVTPAESGMNLDADAIVTTASAQMNPWAWPVELFGEHNLADSAEVSVNDTALGDYIAGHVDTFNKTHSASEDARIEYDSDSSEFAIIPEVYGEQLDNEKVVGAVTACIFRNADTCEISSDEILMPTVLADDKNIVAGVKAANGMLGVNATFKSPLDNSTLGTLDSALLSQWITFDKNFKPSVKQEALSEWATGMVSSLSTVGSTRTYTRPDGKQVTVSGGTFGCSVNNDTIVTKINDAIKNKTKGDIALERTCTGIQGPDGSDTEWGAYVDVDLSEQYARYYDESGNVLWESYIVSGNPTKGWGTPTGVWYVNNKQQNSVLRGERDKKTGKPEYELPVAYWMPFIGNSHGLHDVIPSWRSLSDYGVPNIQYIAGSHGCVNIPPAVAGQLYSLVSVGTPVVVHN